MIKNQAITTLVALLVVLNIAFVGCYSDPSPSVVNQSQTENDETTSSSDDGEKVPARYFEFKYGAKLLDVPEGAEVKVWMPIAQTSAFQTITLGEVSTPVEMQRNKEPKYGNEIGFFQSTAIESSTEFSLTYEVVREEASVDSDKSKLTDEEKKSFLGANKMVPISGKPLELLDDVELPVDSMAAGRMLYNVVEDHMKYDKSQPGYGKGDVEWACDSQTGNCTDFHSLFISLARSKDIPSRFEIGFPIPADKKSGEIGGYHCWAWFHVDGKGWAPVDISEADKHPEMKEYYFGKLTRDRVAFSVGRDIELVPASENGALNYFVYPHVEVDGKPWPKDKIDLDFSFTEK